MKNELRKICMHISFLNDLDRYSKADAKYFIIYYQCIKKFK
ncbi:hypothetical protein SM168_13615 [Acinetobacter baumannii]|uniref:Uncharacterized protein n=1 Tax=Acinetobacter baumannii TaxID=470 RepID=A0A429LCB4_ACIBA|nr:MULTISPECIES: hypothetical protein [Acinetobacter]MCO9047995.1 hypothetical protein [Acinetobacter sp. UC24323]ASO71365.1 hypothetical protein Aba7804_11485 [Acinetobacter baumannii]AVN31573.1 hypothetical protein AM467_10135 [Acinetobacter baumannii]AYX88669.1 hypothetical protein EGX84_13255 [Acinetobacter baumannii]EHF3480396.1 hypothetical protein [Acinetobacter baumannii]